MTSTQTILDRAGVSKGALYHHFPGKSDLMAAVFEQVGRETLARANAAIGNAATARERLERVILAWLKEVARPEPRRILLELGPQELGWEKARAIEQMIAVAALRQLIEQAVREGEARCQDAALAATIINAAVGELAVTVKGPGGDTAMHSAAPMIRAMIDALLPPAA